MAWRRFFTLNVSAKRARGLPLCPSESKPSANCRGKVDLLQAGLRSTGGWGRSGLRRELDLQLQTFAIKTMLHVRS